MFTPFFNSYFVRTQGGFEVDVKHEYFLRRREKKIRMVHLAKYIGCSQSLISKYETGVAKMCNQKIRLYREYIDKN